MAVRPDNTTPANIWLDILEPKMVTGTCDNCGEGDSILLCGSAECFEYIEYPCIRCVFSACGFMCDETCGFSLDHHKFINSPTCCNQHPVSPCGTCITYGFSIAGDLNGKCKSCIKLHTPVAIQEVVDIYVEEYLARIALRGEC